MIESDEMSIKKLLFGTTNDTFASLGFVIARISIGMTMFHFTVGYAPALATNSTLSFAVLLCHICVVLIMFGILSRPAALVILLNIMLYNGQLFPIHGDPIHPWQEELILYSGFYALILFAGAGRFSLDSLFFNKSKQE